MFRRFLLLSFVAVVTIVLPAGIVALAVQQDPGLSALDEVAHLDYLDRAGDRSFPRMGDVVSDEVARTARCRSVETEQGVACGDVVIPDGPPVVADGYSYEAQHPPLYYWISAGLQNVTRIGPGDNFITTGRLTGAFWLSGGAIMLFLALRRLGVTNAAAGAVCTFLTFSPGLVVSASKVTNDATSLFGGAAILLAYTELRRRPTAAGIAVLTATSIVAVLLKPVNILTVGAIALMASVELLSRVGWRRALVCGATPAAFAVATVVAWQALVEAMAVVEVDVVMDALLGFKKHSDGPPFGRFFLSSANLLAAYDSGRSVVGPGAAGFATIGRVALLGTAAAAGLTGRRTVAAIAGAASVATLVVGGFAFNVQFWLSFGLLGGPAPRYGLSLLPVLAVPMAIAGSRSRRSVVGLWTLASAMGVSTVLGVVLAS